MSEGLEETVDRAKGGDRAALEAVVRAVQDRVYNLALRMLWHPEDAEDATQEILVKVVTRLGSFRGESAFATWVYRVASNHLLTTRKRRAEREGLTFSRFAEQLDEGLADEAASVEEDAEMKVLAEEVKVGCTHGMLLCLDREHRLAYVLGEVFEVTGEQGAYVLGITPAAFRQRLSRARRRIGAFMQKKCGLLDPENPCRCARRVDHAVRTGRVDPDRLLFVERSGEGSSEPLVLEKVREMERLEGAATIFRGHPDYAAPRAYAEGVRDLIGSGRFGVLRD